MLISLIKVTRRFNKVNVVTSHVRFVLPFFLEVIDRRYRYSSQKSNTYEGRKDRRREGMSVILRPSISTTKPGSAYRSIKNITFLRRVKNSQKKEMNFV